jgi:hypothetical protein
VTLAPAAGVSVGETYTMVVTVANSGQASAAQVSPNSIAKLGTATELTSLSGPQPATATVATGVPQAFTYTGVDTVGGSGPSPWGLAYGVAASGVDVNSGLAVSASSVQSNYIGVSQPAALLSSLTVTASSANVGQTVSLILTVSNTGDATAGTVKPLAIGQIGTGSFVLGGPGSQTAVSLAKNVSASFTWTYVAEGTGTVTFSVYASGIDQNSLTTVNSNLAEAGPVSVQVPAQLSVVSIAPLTASLGTGSTGTVVMTVQNVGTTPALNVSASALAALGGATPVISAPQPVNVASLAAGGRRRSRTRCSSARRRCRR